MGFQATKNVNVRQKNIGLKIKTIMVERNVANGIDMELSMFDEKMNGLSEWKLSECKKLCNFLNVELSYIFLE